MAITINTNVTSLVAQRNLNNAQGALSESMERLSSGLRINRAKDDAAGMAISNTMEKKISGLNQATRNANDGISVIQVTEGVLSQVEGSLRRMSDLATQASTGSYDAANRSAMNVEFSALRSEIDRVVSKAEFNGFKVADGTQSSMILQVGADNTANDRLSVSLINSKVSALGVSGNSVRAASAAQAAISSIDAAIKKVGAARSGLGASESRLGSAIENNLTNVESLSAANSRIKDLDFAEEVSSMTKNNVLVQAGTSMLAQANSMPQLALSILG